MATRVFVDAEGVRRIVRDEIQNNEYQKALWNALFSAGHPITKDQASDMMDGKIGNFALRIPTLVRDEAGKFLLSSTGISEMLTNHRSRVNEDLRDHQSQIEVIMRRNITDLNTSHELQLNTTKRAMEDASKTTVDKILRSDEGGAIMKGIEEKLRGNQNMMFYGGILASLAAGALGGFIGANMRK
ncbi:Hypothetical protein HVR_LOCUS157 [uncultured virus]|nr:Hypothetical protein HVR_LOCUS157 [uncultured virus]